MALYYKYVVLILTKLNALFFGIFGRMSLLSEILNARKHSLLESLWHCPADTTFYCRGSATEHVLYCATENIIMEVPQKILI